MRVSKEGGVKILDLGLAKIAASDLPPEQQSPDEAEIVAVMTRAGSDLFGATLRPGTVEPQGRGDGLRLPG